MSRLRFVYLVTTEAGGDVPIVEVFGSVKALAEEVTRWSAEAEVDLALYSSGVDDWPATKEAIAKELRSKRYALMVDAGDRDMRVTASRMRVR